MPPAITLRDLCASWGTRRVLRDLCVEVPQGETLCIVGPGGSGKSTLLRVLEALSLGVMPVMPDPTGLRWRVATPFKVDACARLRQHGDFTPLPISLLLANAGIHANRDNDETWMPAGEPERARLRAFYDIPLNEAPEPIRRFVSFTLVANSSAPLLLIDEPRFGLDGPWAQRVTATLRRLADQRRTMVIVTHHLPLARAIADQVMLLVDGHLLESAATEDFFCRSEHPRTRQYVQSGG
jgi:ABC-type arginine transport system ATPase subunit